ncbi:sugar 3,4-ketoisomerase [Hymenobacter actinosclerus]|uniref:WxcM-like, C-terminal n=1 Tax=Hymenobacter actinosclerus TaxID=82805 RepID=A0A1I0GXD9_9BACT|nr:FdtA/QdtA family cupin domain-containing protein [Hymenobacter actinosclerus]SET75850.1 WxcM-like, C-terminal [Hymenobacter actinosclerus]
MSVPHLIEFAKTGSAELGFITVAQNSELPFEIKRVYWTYDTPDSVVRGHHAHHDLEQIIFATSGRIEFDLENLRGENQKFILDSPNVGLYIPKLYWRTIMFSHQAVLMCLTSQEYIEEDYIRSYTDFENMKSLHKITESK